MGNELIEYGMDKFFGILRDMFESAINADTLPKECTTAYIISIFKKGDRRKFTNYRDIGFANDQVAIPLDEDLSYMLRKICRLGNTFRKYRIFRKKEGAVEDLEIDR